MIKKEIAEIKTEETKLNGNTKAIQKARQEHWTDYITSDWQLNVKWRYEEKRKI